MTYQSWASEAMAAPTVAARRKGELPALVNLDSAFCSSWSSAPDGDCRGRETRREGGSSMATTMAQALAERIRYQISAGEKLLQAAGSNSGAVFGNPQDVLSVRGNVSDVAHTNHLWLLDLLASKAVEGELPAELRRPRPTTVEAAVAFLAPRDTDSAEQAQQQLQRVNTQIASLVQGLSDTALEAPVEVTFYGQKSLRDLLFVIIEHGALHIGQAWGILKGKGLAQ
jgi:uncharacterized damage-inducible protein DinB